jgi:hypothetical protein
VQPTAGRRRSRASSSRGAGRGSLEARAQFCGHSYAAGLWGAQGSAKRVCFSIFPCGLWYHNPTHKKPFHQW